MSDEASKEQQAALRIREAMAGIAADLATLWHWGDGYGGWILEQAARASGKHTALNIPKKRQGLRRTMSRKTAKQVFERDAYRCKSCLTHTDLCVDHIVPLAYGGTDDLANLQTLCRPCNSSKGARPMSYITGQP